jgi:hypothetical protein
MKSILFTAEKTPEFMELLATGLSQETIALGFLHQQVIYGLAWSADFCALHLQRDRVRACHYDDNFCSIVIQTENLAADVLVDQLDTVDYY